MRFIAFATSLISQLYPAVSAATTIDKRAVSNLTYVQDYAPIVYLHSADPYRPADIGAQLQHTVPVIDGTIVPSFPSPLTLDNLYLVATRRNTTPVYLTSKDYIDVDNNPAWTKGVTPSSSGKTEGATSCAIIVHEHDTITVDAFYMYFYAFNYGDNYQGINMNNHVGDWEHNMIRFRNGVPTEMWYSQHESGEAFTYDAVEKDGRRPIVYSANGSHANYATAGSHARHIQDYPQIDFLAEYTDAGVKWDPTLSAYYYRYQVDSDTVKAYDEDTPTGWLEYFGGWGDQRYPDSDRRQSNINNTFYHYEDGPHGPLSKQIFRPTTVCPELRNGAYKCNVKTSRTA